jgi:hypothetical protein
MRPGGGRWCSTPWPRRVHLSRYHWKRSRFGWRRSRIRYGCGCCAPWPAHHQRAGLRLGTFTPEVSRHLAVLRRAGLLTARRHGRYVSYTLNLPDLTALGADLLAAVLR